jgi:hypothetical protein
MTARGVFILVFLLVFPGTAMAVDGKVLHHGIFEMERPGQGSWQISDVRLTDVVKAKIGTKFGIVFEVTSLESRQAVIEAILIHPPIIHPTDGMRTKESAEMGPFDVVNGRVQSSYGFGFDHEYEMVPGAWTIEIWVQGAKILEKRFSVVNGR